MTLKTAQGFSFIELIIVVVIVAVLAAVAVPMYTEQITRTRRTDAKIALLDLAARMERYYAEHHTFATATIATNSATDIAASKESPDGLYTLSIINQAPTSFLLQATPIAGSAQAANDAQCGALQINQLGQKSITGAGDARRCWHR